jgi:hypothetical protein
MLFSKLPQAISLFLLSAYYKFLGGFPFVAVAGLLLYVGCYQVIILSFKDWNYFFLTVTMRSTSIVSKDG